MKRLNLAVFLFAATLALLLMTRVAWSASLWTSPATGTIYADPAATKVGIGTLGPNEQMEIASTTGGRFIVSDGTGTSRRVLLLQSPTASDNYARLLGHNYGTSTGVNLVLQDSGGNVGIGTTSPGGKLDIAQSSGSDYFRISRPGGFNTYGFSTSNNGTSNGLSLVDVTNSAIRLFVDNYGNIGIGTTSPIGQLEVVGNTHWVNGWKTGIVSTSADYPTFRLRATGSGTTSFIGNNNNGGLYFGVNGSDSAYGSYAMAILPNGNIGIGTTTPNYKLDVYGTIRALEVKVETGWSDYVFDKDYTLPSLAQVETYISENKHLPDMPSAQEVKDNGLSVAEMMAKQMKKIEELTLYLIEMKRENESLKQISGELIQRDAELTQKIAVLENKIKR